MLKPLIIAVFFISFHSVFASLPPAAYPADSTKKEKKKKKYLPDHSPKKAMLYSMILPGLGQVYNRKYWKPPIIYAGGITLGILISYNHNQFKQFRDAYEYRTDNDPATTDNMFPSFSDNTVRNLRDSYRKDRDLSIILTGVLYILNVADAYIDAHFINFDVSDDLSMSVNPKFAFSNITGVGLELKLNF